MDLLEKAVRSTASTVRVADGTLLGRPLTEAEITRMVETVRGTQFEGTFRQILLDNPAKLADGSIYTLYSGEGQGNLARDFRTEMLTKGQPAGLIENTKWGKYVDGRERKGDATLYFLRRNCGTNSFN
jgi:hypothetical protein